jgi:hypothetical protein
MQNRAGRSEVHNGRGGERGVSKCGTAGDSRSFGSSANASRLNYTPIIRLNSWTASQPPKVPSGPPKMVRRSSYTAQDVCHMICCQHGDSNSTPFVIGRGIKSVYEVLRCQLLPVKKEFPFSSPPKDTLCSQRQASRCRFRGLARMPPDRMRTSKSRIWMDRSTTYIRKGLALMLFPG